jgi:hypothetical protein
MFVVSDNYKNICCNYSGCLILALLLTLLLATLAVRLTVLAVSLATSPHHRLGS